MALDTLAHCAAVAQWIEHLPPKERVAGSIPASRTSLPCYRHLGDGTPLRGYKFPEVVQKMTRQPSGPAGLFIRQEPCALSEQPKVGTRHFGRLLDKPGLSGWPIFVHGRGSRNGTIDPEIAGLARCSKGLLPASNLSTIDARNPVHNLWTNFHVGDVQRHKNPAKTRFPPGCFWLQ
jgi:hypothetical protein